MVFSSHLFLFYFLPLTLALYYAAPRAARLGVLCLLSYGFYGWANPAFVALMLASTAVDYFCGLAISGAFASDWRQPLARLQRSGERSAGQKAVLALTILSNLTLLGFFKYFNFFVDSVDALAVTLGLTSWTIHTALRVTLPLGISFYTFQSMSYSIDVYRGDATAIRNPIDFACYVAMFPQLVAGPIVRYSLVADQLHHRTHTLEKFARGAAMVALGLTKKVLLANPCGKVADTMFGADAPGCANAWFGAVSYAFQIYFDFSGYSDMAIGLALMLGFEFPKNFDSPYHSASITEFWRRWHISLSSWIRDYLYVPLQMRLRYWGSFRNVLPLAITFLLCGLWHGAAWNFVVWGGLHGAMIIAERAMGTKRPTGRLPHGLRVAATFVAVVFAWVFFRADSLPHAAAYCGAMLGLGHAGAGAALVGGIAWQPYYVATFAACAVVVWGFPQTWDFTRRLTPLRTAGVLAAFGVAVTVLTTQEFNPFIYFFF